MTSTRNFNGKTEKNIAARSIPTTNARIRAANTLTKANITVDNFYPIDSWIYEKFSPISVGRVSTLMLSKYWTSYLIIDFRYLILKSYDIFSAITCQKA